MRPPKLIPRREYFPVKKIPKGMIIEVKPFLDPYLDPIPGPSSEDRFPQPIPDSESYFVKPTSIKLPPITD